MPENSAFVDLGDHPFRAAELREILESVADGISVQDAAGKLIYANPAAEALAAQAPVEAPCDFSERLYRFHDPVTGEERSWVVRPKPLLDADGSIRLIVNAWHDVTERMREQQKLEFAVERQRFLAEAGRLLAASLDPEATLRTITHLAVPRIADWVTVTLIDGAGTPRRLATAHADPNKLQFLLELQKRYPPDPEQTLRIARSGNSELYSDLTQDMLRAIAHDDEQYRGLVELGLRSGMVVPLKIRGHVLGTLSFMSGDSGRRFDGDDLEFAESLAARSALALTNARLYKEAQEANRVKADFLAVMSHELRTPLTAIFGYTELLSTEISGPVSEHQKEQLDRIRASATHLLGIIEDILNYARSEAGRDTLNIGTVRLSDVVSEATALVRLDAEEKRLELVEDVAQDCVLRTDHGKLRQILTNLLSNAVKFTEAGRVTVRGRCEAGWATLEVADTGPGIPESQIGTIFEPFRQLESANTRRAGGTGLGLAVTKRFAELLGGSIEVRTRVGEGTVFTVDVPMELSVPQ